MAKPAKKKGQRLAKMTSTALAVQDPAPIREASPSNDAAKPTGSMFSRSYDGFAVGAAWLDQLARNEDSMLKREGGTKDLELATALLDDDVAFSTFQQRQLALVARPWEVAPGDEKDPRSVKAADDLRAMLKALGWDRVCSLMIYARWYGYGVAEGIYQIKDHDGRQIVWLDDIVVPDRGWFAFTNSGELRMRTPTDADGVKVPPNKFWTVRVGADNDFVPYGKGLFHWCYWPIWFKRNVLQFWALYLEKLGQPTVVGYFQPGASQDDITDLVAALTAIGSDSAVALPAPPLGTGTQDLRPSLMEATRSGGAQSYEQFVDNRDDATRGVILGQPGTSRGVTSGMNSNQSDVHKDVRDEVVQADSDMLHEGFNSTFPVWLTLWNYGPDVAPPTVYRNMDDQEDLTAVATRDVQLNTLGWQRTDQNFMETYGEGYERKPEPPPVPVIMPGQRNPVANDNPARRKAVAAFAAHFAANDPAPLYVSRKLTNADAVLEWARGQGFTDLYDASELHVTVLYSRTPVDWFQMDDRWGMRADKMEVPPGGARKVEPMGDSGTVALVFGSPELRYRHDSMVEMGASHDYESYLPHVSFANSSASVADLAKVEAFIGPLEFGPEIFEPLEEDPILPSIAAFSADQLDQIDQFTASLVDDTEAEFAAMGNALRDKLAAFTANGATLTPEGLRLAMLQAWERFPIDRLARKMALPLTAEHAAESAGVPIA